MAGLSAGEQCLTFEGHRLRCLLSGDVVWFVAKDVLQALGTQVEAGVASYLGPFKHDLRRLPRPKGVGGNPPAALPHEALLAFLQRSRRDLAPALLRNLAEDILPTAIPGFSYTVHRPEVKAHQERQAREREAKRLARETKAARREAVLALRQPNEGASSPSQLAGQRERSRNYQRRRVFERTGRWPVPRAEMLAAKRKEAVERINLLTAKLNGTLPAERIDSEEDWAMTASELAKLWPQSGDKVCGTCGETVPPSTMLPPLPGNFYQGKCNPCAREAWEAGRRATYGPVIGPLEEPRRIPLRDGTLITVGQLAARHRERQARYRVTRWGRGSFF